MDKSVCERMFLILLSVYPGVEFPSYMVTLFNFLRNYQTAQHRGCTILPLRQHCMSVPVSPPLPTFVSLCPFFVVAILVGMKQYFIVVLISRSLMSNDIEHLFMFLLAICTSLESRLFISFAYF